MFCSHLEVELLPALFAQQSLEVLFEQLPLEMRGGLVLKKKNMERRGGGIALMSVQCRLMSETYNLQYCSIVAS